jgi:hypothetical protein
MTDKMQMLAEAYDYRGVFFEENFTYSHLLKAFYEDVNKYGTESAEEMYVTLFGEETKDVFSYMNENFDYLEEASAIKSEILFEGFAEKYLSEANPLSGGMPRSQKAIDAVAKRSQGLDKKNIGMVRSSALEELTGSAKKISGVSGFLKGLWDKLKGLGTGAISKLKDLVGKGIPWAKEIAQKGASFFTGNPIAQVALPAVALAGGVAAGWKLLRKMKKKKLSDQDKEKFKEVLDKNKSQVKQYA